MKKEFQEIKRIAHKYDTAILILSTLLFQFIIYLTPFYSNTFQYILLALYVILVLLLLYDRKNPKKNAFYIIYLVGVLIRTLYIINTSIYVRQHDVGNTHGTGHLGYIYMLYHTHQLPPNISGLFYHPPLWHLLGCFWLEFNKLMGINIIMSLEGIQLLTLFLSSFSILAVKSICDKLKLKEKYILIAIAFISFHPTMIILSGSISNDMLLTFLEIMIINFLIKWYDQTTIKNTIILAITTGLCVMTKTNGAIMAIPIMYVFIKKFIEVYHNKLMSIKEYIKKILLFGIISLPIGIWFPIRNMIKFHDYHFVLDLGENMYTGNHSIISRFFILNLKMLLRSYWCFVFSVQ